MPESPVDYWPNMAQGDAVHDVCPECLKVGRDDQRNQDPNANAARIVGEATASNHSVRADLEAAWAEWSSQIHMVDEPGMTLLRAAFEAGWDARRS
jgi:hypothetical protein